MQQPFAPSHYKDWYSLSYCPTSLAQVAEVEKKKVEGKAVVQAAALASGTAQSPPRGDNDGCYNIHDEATCVDSYDGRPPFGQQPCAWCCGNDCGNGYRCEPRDWLMQQPFAPSHYNEYHLSYCPTSLAQVKKVEGLQTEKEHEESVAEQAPFRAEEMPNSDTSNLTPALCYLLNDAADCLTSKDSRSGPLLKDQACVWCCGGQCGSRFPGVQCQPYQFLVNERDDPNLAQTDVLISGEFFVAGSYQQATGLEPNSNIGRC